MKAYQVKITVKGSHPPIWRRCIIPAGITFSQLAVLLNEIMGWKGYHLFAFQFQDMGICIEEIDEDYSDPAYDLKEAAEAVIGLIFHIGAQKEIRVSNVVIEAILEQLCREAGIRLKRVKKLGSIEEFRQEMQRFGF